MPFLHKQDFLPGCQPRRNLVVMLLLVLVIAACLGIAIVSPARWGLFAIEAIAATVLGFHPGCWVVTRFHQHGEH